MLAGEPYDPFDPLLVRERERARDLVRRFGDAPAADANTRQEILDELLGSMGESATIEPPFRCDYGFNIRAGNGFLRELRLRDIGHLPGDVRRRLSARSRRAPLHRGPPDRGRSATRGRRVRRASHRRRERLDRRACSRQSRASRSATTRSSLRARSSSKTSPTSRSSPAIPPGSVENSIETAREAGSRRPNTRPGGCLSCSWRVTTTRNQERRDGGANGGTGDRT